MYIDKVVLKNIRGFEHLDFDLGRGDGNYAGWTVFTGDNGAGKSTLLKAIAVGLTGRDVARSLQPSFHRWIREGAGQPEAKIELMIVPERGVDEFSKKGNTGYKKFSASVLLQSGADGTVELPATSGSKATLAQRGLWSAASPGWFSCGYGPFRRVFGASPDATRLMVSPTTERFVTMFQEAASLYEVDQWMRNLSHKSLEGRSPQSGQELTLLLEILRDDLMPNQITVDGVDSGGLWLRDRNGLRLAWSDMSDGYRSALALLADILRHLIAAYGIDDLAKRGLDGKLQVVRSGVVMIDEIDAHLHPEWQREIGPWLKQHFPNIQFLVTTHSPIICQAADVNGLFVLPEPGSGDAPRALTREEYNKVITSRPDTILLTPAFNLQNTRSPRAVASRVEYNKLMAKKSAGATLTKAERSKADQLEMFANTDEAL